MGMETMSLLGKAFLAVSLTIEDFEPYWFVIWLCLFAFFCLIELFTVRAYANCLALASLFSLILSLIPSIPFYYDIICFVVLSLLFLFLLRPFLIRRWKEKKEEEKENSNDSSLE